MGSDKTLVRPRCRWE